MAARRSRRSRRDHHHEASHAGVQDPAPAIPEHPAIPGNEPTIVSTPSDLSGLIEHVRSAGMFAYDTEFIGEETYIPKLCLLQIATREQLFLIDPFTVGDLGPIWSLLSDPDILTIVHAGEQDLEPVERCTGLTPANIIDTQIAVGFIGYPYPLSLTKTIQVITGCEVSKGMTFTKWDDRPLSDMQKRYAADDVRYLPLAWEHIEPTLKSLKHLDWCLEECTRDCRPGAFSINVGHVCSKFHRRNTLRRAQWYRLCHLVKLRDELARADNLPPRKLIPDGCLSDMARRQPTSTDDLHHIKGLPRPTIQRHGSSLLAALDNEASTDGLPELPTKLPEETPKQRVRIDALWAMLSSWCISEQIAPSLLTTRADLAGWVLSGGQTLDVDHLWEDGWKRACAGGFLTRFLSGDLALTMKWKEDRLHQTSHKD